MAFVRVKKRGAQQYYELVENHRVAGRVQQKVVVYLGPHATLNAAIAAVEAEIVRHSALKEEYEDKAREGQRQITLWTDDAPQCDVMYVDWNYRSPEECRTHHFQVIRGWEATTRRHQLQAATEERALLQLQMRLDRLQEAQRLTLPP